MTQKLMTTIEVNKAVENILPTKIYTISEIIALGFEPVYVTNHGTYYWADDTGQKLYALLRADKVDIEEEKGLAYEDGYKKGRALGIESGMRHMHSLFMEYLMDTNWKLAEELQIASDSFLRPMITPKLNKK